MSKFLSVQIVAAEVVGTNAVEITYKFVGSSKRITRMTSIDEARKPTMRVGKFLQIPVSDSEVLEIFGKREIADKDKKKPEPVIELDEGISAGSDLY